MLVMFSHSRYFLQTVPSEITASTNQLFVIFTAPPQALTNGESFTAKYRTLSQSELDGTP